MTLTVVRDLSTLRKTPAAGLKNITEHIMVFYRKPVVEEEPQEGKEVKSEAPPRSKALTAAQKAARAPNVSELERVLGPSRMPYGCNVIENYQPLHHTNKLKKDRKFWTQENKARIKLLLPPPPPPKHVAPLGSLTAPL